MKVNTIDIRFSFGGTLVLAAAVAGFGLPLGGSTIVPPVPVTESTAQTTITAQTPGTCCSTEVINDTGAVAGVSALTASASFPTPINATLSTNATAAAQFGSLHASSDSSVTNSSSPGIGATSRAESQFWDILSVSQPCLSGYPTPAMGSATVSVDLTGSLFDFSSNLTTNPLSISQAEIQFEVGFTDLTTVENSGATQNFTGGIEPQEFYSSTGPSFNVGAGEYFLNFNPSDPDGSCSGGGGDPSCTSTPIAATQTESGGFKLSFNLPVLLTGSVGLYGSLFVVSAAGTRNPQSGAVTVSADADYSDTATITVSQILDQNGNSVGLNSLASVSGADYAAGSGAPEPSSFALLLLGGLLVGIGGVRRKCAKSR